MGQLYADSLKARHDTIVLQPSEAVNQYIVRSATLDRPIFRERWFKRNDSFFSSQRAESDRESDSPFDVRYAVDSSAKDPLAGNCNLELECIRTVLVISDSDLTSESSVWTLQRQLHRIAAAQTQVGKLIYGSERQAHNVTRFNVFKTIHTQDASWCKRKACNNLDRSPAYWQSVAHDLHLERARSGHLRDELILQAAIPVRREA